MAPRTRILAFGSAGALVLAGAVCAALVGGLTGEILTTALITAGLGGAVLLVFLEVGLSEDREQARDEERRRRRAQGVPPAGTLQAPPAPLARRRCVEHGASPGAGPPR